jgi:hypothetical protein
MDAHREHTSPGGGPEIGLKQRRIGEKEERHI